MEHYPFDSRNRLYKSKYGAVASGERLKLRLLLHNDAKVTDAFLLLRNDNENDFRKIPLTPAEELDGYRFYEVETSLCEGLYWYYFCFDSSFGEQKVMKAEHSLGIVTDSGGLWQLTVYDADYKTPDTLAGGVIYQIFPDRFFRSGETHENVPEDRFLQNDWYAVPQYRQNDTPYTLGNDYYGGDLKGIAKKLPYLSELGVTVIYLNPIFEAHSNHRYNTADYMKIDPLLGNERDFSALCKKADEYGIKIILDGVFSHTGSDSIYFNKNLRYASDGAYNSQTSPYYGWYSFSEYPRKYKAWWGVDTLPEVNENEPSYTGFICGENGVVRKYLRLGAYGWRLDVADELPDEIIDNIRAAMKTEKPDSFLLGEVWEDATNKFSHGCRRRFLRGRQLDSVMNYPFCDAIINFLLGGNSRDFIDTVLNITENYPAPALHLLMNHIGTHDTARILTVLGKNGLDAHDREWQANNPLTPEEYAHGVKFLKLAAALQFTLPGIPSVYYGDEAGISGFGDPFCRAAFPWGRENEELTGFYKVLGKMRKENSCFKNGEFITLFGDMGYVVYMRRNEESAVLTAVNRWCDSSVITLPDGFENAEVIIGNAPEGKTLTVPPESAVILKI